MMEKVWAGIKSHPYLIGGAVVLIILVYYLYTSGSSATASSVESSTTTDPNADALAAAQLQAQVQNNAITASSAEQNNQDQITMQTNTLAANLGADQINSSLQATIFGDQTSQNIALGQVQGQVDLAQIQTQGQTDIANIEASSVAQQLAATVSIAGLQAGVSNNEITTAGNVADFQAETQLSALQSETNLQDSANYLQAGVVDNEISAGVNENNANDTTAVEIGNQNDNTLTAIAGIQSNTQLGVANLAAITQNNAIQATQNIQTQSLFSKIF